jgi:TIR domain-containing protein
MTTQNKKYDLAVSFSGTQRPYVENVVRECKKLGLEVFYDMDAQVQLWGRNVITELRKIYGSVSTRYVVPFLSRDYLAGPYPMDELRSALLRAIEQEDYILPVLMDDVEVPAEYMSPATIYLRADDYPPDRLAMAILERIGLEHQQASPTSLTSHPVTNSMPRPESVQLPKLAPTQFSAESTLDETLRHVGRRFMDEISALEEYGFRSHVRTSTDYVSVVVEEANRPKCELKLARGDSLWAGSLTMAFQWPRISGGTNGFVQPEWDPESKAAKLRYQDMSAGGADPLLTAEELFQVLWKKIVTFLDQTSR